MSYVRVCVRACVCVCAIRHKNGVSVRDFVFGKAFRFLSAASSRPAAHLVSAVSDGRVAGAVAELDVGDAHGECSEDGAVSGRGRGQWVSALE